MTPLTVASQEMSVLPDHTQLPDTDGSIVENFQEQPQNELLNGCLMPRLNQLHPDHQFAVGNDSGVYWKHTEPPLEGCKSPDWFYVPGVPPMLNGVIRRSYVLWQEKVPPLVAIEYVSKDGSEERDRTPGKGKFWVYEQGIKIQYYAIYDVNIPLIEMYKLVEGRYAPVPPNAAGRYPIEPLGVELGLWMGTYRDMTLPWLRAWDSVTGAILPSLPEVAEEHLRQAEEYRRQTEIERRRAENAESIAEFKGRELALECERAEVERRRADLLAERLRALGIDPDKI